MLTAIDPNGVVTALSYDSFENPIKLVADSGGSGHLNTTTQSAYDALGNVLARTDPNGNTTAMSYDADRRPVAVTGPAPFGGGLSLVQTTNTYDPDGHVIVVTRSNGASNTVTLSSYTATGQVQSVTDPNGSITTTSYDADDRLTSVTDPLFRRTVYAYDAMSRHISVSNPAIQAAPLLQQSYTPDGLIASLTDANSNATTFAPDGFDRLSTTTYPGSSTEVLSYDADGNVLSRKTRAGATISFGYDTLNRLSTKAAPSEATVSYAYDLASRLIGVGDNSASIGTPAASASYATTLGYDQLNRLLAVNWTPAPSQATPTANSSTFGYVYDATNRRLSQSATDNSWWYYPPAATKVGYTANNLNQYTAVGTVSPTYDGNGNLTSDGTFSYGYDAENRLISASGSGLTATYAYDAQGRRKSKTVNSTTTIFVTDADNREVLEYSGNSGGIANWYAYALGPNDALNQMNVAGSTRETLIPDIQGSFVATLDSTTGGLTKGGFLPYGESSSSSGTFRYTGQRIDPETNGLYYYRARMYMPAWGRFMQVDPIGYFSGNNLYRYVRNDPFNFIDPYGLAPDAPQAAAAAGGNGGNDDEPPKIAAAVPGEEPQNNNENEASLRVGGSGSGGFGGGGFGGGRGTEGLAFSQITASPWFNPKGNFAGQTISDVVSQLRAGSLSASDVPVRTIGNLIVNTRSSLALMQAGIPQSQWTLIEMAGDAEAEAAMNTRLSENGLTSAGTSTLRITGSGQNASTLVGAGTIPPPGP